MARIYQGGGAERRFQSSARGRQYNPTQAASNSKAIKEQGQQILDNLKTIDRERQRNDQMSDLQQDYADKSAQLNLKIKFTVLLNQ